MEIKTKTYCYYIRENEWNNFLNEYKSFGFEREGGFAYPDYVYKIVDVNKKLKINISEPCVNMWDGEDKNSQREVWLWNENMGRGSKAIVAPYIRDLIEAGYIE